MEPLASMVGRDNTPTACSSNGRTSDSMVTMDVDKDGTDDVEEEK